jgi:hypothetical protein
MPEEFVSMRAWLAHAGAVVAPDVEKTAAPPPDDPGVPTEEDEAFADLCGELRRFRAALLDALECADGGRVAQLQVRCGTIDACIDIDAHRLARALA